MAITTLRPFPGKPLELIVYEGDKADKKVLFHISGGLHDWWSEKIARPWRKFHYDLSELYLADPSAFEKLYMAVATRGKHLVIDDVSFDNALEATIEIRGYMNEDDTKKTRIIRKVWFAYR